MKSRNLLVAAVILVALSGVVYWTQKHPQSTTTTSTTPPTPTLAAIPDAQIQEIDLKKKNNPELTLQRQNGKWAITSPEQVATDQDAANSVASALNSITADSVVEDKATDLAKFGLKDPSLVVTVHEKNGKTENLQFGDDVPTGSLVYASANSNPKVYTVFSSTKTSFDKSLNDLRDKRLLLFDTNNLTSIQLASAKSNIEFGKNNQNEWQIVKPQPYRADNFQVEELLRKLTDAKMDVSGSADDQKKVDAGYGSGQPVGAAKVTDASGTQTLDVRKNKDDYYAKSSAVKGVYKISSDLGKEIEKPLEDFRNKKVFDFGFSDPNKIEVQQGASDKIFTRTGSDWKLNGQTMDPGQVQAFIDKVRDLAAAKFVTEGFTTATVMMTVTSNDGKRVEKAELAKTNVGYIARRGSEPALYQLDAKAVNDMLDASNAIKPAASPKKK